MPLDRIVEVMVRGGATLLAAKLLIKARLTINDAPEVVVAEAIVNVRTGNIVENAIAWRDVHRPIPQPQAGPAIQDSEEKIAA